MKAARSIACFVVWALVLAPAALPVLAQSKVGAGKVDAASALAATLSAACRRDEPTFAAHLTTQTAAVFRKLPQEQRDTLMGRLAMLNGAGKSLLSSGTGGQPVVRCDSAGAVTELRLGAPETAENLAFVPAEAHAGTDSRNVRFGLVREAGEWRLLSVGLLMLDLPAMVQEWAETDIRASEVAAARSLREIADALDVYRRAFDHLPESLDQLGPAPKDGLSPDHAGLLDAALSMGLRGNYRFRYVIVPVAGDGSQAERDQQAGYALAATPAGYGQPATGRRSFYLDSKGTLRGADKQGEPATFSDAEIGEPRL